MEKIPVGETIANAYGFAFRNFLKIFGIVWAPLAVSIVIGLMATPGFFGNHIDPNDREAMNRFALQILPLTLLILLPIRAMIATGVTEQALGMRTGTTFVYFSVAPAIWRFIASWLLVIVAMVVLIVGVAIVFAVGAIVVGAAFGDSLHGANGPGVVLAAIAIFLLAFYAAMILLVVRLTFFIAPVVVVEKKVDLARVWQLSHGNFWRIFVIGLALMLPLVLVAVIVAFAIYAPVMGQLNDVFQLALHGAKQDVLQPHIEAWSAAMRARSLAMWPYNAVFQMLFGTISCGLLYGAAAFAYRAVVPVPGAVSMRD